MGFIEKPSLAEAMQGLWVRFLPQITERVAILEAAATALSNGNLSASQSEQASSAAHKLAGVLGTFGLSRGTELAREAELQYSSLEIPSSSGCRRLCDIAEELRSLIDTQG